MDGGYEGVNKVQSMFTGSNRVSGRGTERKEGRREMRKKGCGKAGAGSESGCEVGDVKNGSRGRDV